MKDNLTIVSEKRLRQLLAKEKSAVNVVEAIKQLIILRPEDEALKAWMEDELGEYEKAGAEL